MRFKSHELSGDDWLYATSSDVRADDMYYTYFKTCGKKLIDTASDRCMTRIYPGDNDADDDVELSTCQRDGDKDQEWDIQKSGSYYKIRNPGKNCCLDVFRGDTEGRKDVDCYPCESDSDQLWYMFD